MVHCFIAAHQSYETVSELLLSYSHTSYINLFKIFGPHEIIKVRRTSLLNYEREQIQMHQYKESNIIVCKNKKKDYWHYGSDGN